MYMMYMVGVVGGSGSSHVRVSAFHVQKVQFSVILVVHSVHVGVLGLMHLLWFTCIPQHRWGNEQTNGFIA